MQTAYAIMDIAFEPAMSAGPLWVIALAAVIVSLLFTGIYILFVNKRKANHIKMELKETKKKMDAAKKKKDEKQMKSLMGQMLKVQHQQMMLSLKPMIVSLLFVGVIFSWLSFMYGDVSVPVVDGAGDFKHGDLINTIGLVGAGSESMVSFTDGVPSTKIGQTVEISDVIWELEYKEDIRGFMQKITGADKTEGIVFKNIEAKFNVPFSEKKVSWLWLYIIISFPVTMVSRKVLGVD
ncbi:MAG: DUF106 domain-containing protein [Candidatus Aenigmarchaeota archaeon]|nr:DUF106 domain-containing protein [Candidatus Aenigmarchaeota archaeon]